MKMTFFDKIVANVSPQRAVMRMAAKEQLRFYEAVRPSATRNPIRDGGSANNVMLAEGGRLRSQARYLDENHDLARGVLNDLVAGIVGTGITSTPMVRKRDGSLNVKINDKIRKLHKSWSRRPEVTQELCMNRVQAMLCRAWLRDGEVFMQHVMGTRNDIKYPTAVPYLIEPLESDMVPFSSRGYTNDVANNNFGITRDTWGRAKSYTVYKQHPTDSLSLDAVKEVDASRISHLKFADRFNQSRGTSIFASVMVRLDDIKDYEESERIAARVAAAMTAYIKRSGDVGGLTVNNAGERTFEMSPGMVYDKLQPGEDIGMISSDRPSTNLAPFREGQLRAVAAGTQASYSNVARDFSGSYSSQRQEMVVQSTSYGMLRKVYISEAIDPIYRNFIDMAVAAGELVLTGADKETIYDCEHRGQPSPWIDPKKEAEADVIAVAAGFKSQNQVIRDRTGDPDEVLGQIEIERKYHEEKGLSFSFSQQSNNVDSKKKE